MNRDEIVKVWSVLTSAGAYLVLNSFFRTQGWALVLPGPDFGTAERYSATIYGIAIPWPIWICALTLTMIYAGRHGGASLASRLPPAFNAATNLGDWLGRAYVFVLFALLCLLPILVNIQLIIKFFHGTYFELGDAAKPCGEIGSGFLAHLGSWNHATWDYAYVYGQCGGAGNGAAYYPGVTATALLVMEITLAILLIVTAIKVFSPPVPPATDY